MKIIKNLFLILLISFFVFIEKGYADECSLAQTAIYFGNGINNSHTEALDSKCKLQTAFCESINSEDEDNYKFALAYNQSFGIGTDLLECARQTLGNEWPTLLVAFLLNDTRIINLLPGDIVQRFNDFLTNQTIQELVAPNASNEDVADHVSSYTSDIGEGKKVILVAHSQGNIFANLAYQRLSTSYQQYFTIVPVASPESFVRKSLVGHVRFSDDLVIAGVEMAKSLVGLPSPLSANDQDNIDEDFLSHNFLKAYIKDASAKYFIINAIHASNSSLPDPPLSAGQGTITVTLTWGSNPDVDLHTYEPTGRHVYYAARQGQFGFLDVDDTTSYGPEHYYASCDNLRNSAAAIGRYRFGLNYYYGYSAETCTVTVKTPSVEQTFTKVLTSVRGSSGNNSMIPVADVVVSKNPDTGRLEFAIEAR